METTICDGNINSKISKSTITISSLFNLHDKGESLADYFCNWDSIEMKKRALIGDAIVLLFTRRYLLSKYPDKRVGFIHEMTKMYVSNESMKLFLLSVAEENEKPQLLGMSTHTAGTVFEALLATCSDSDSVLTDYVNKLTDLLDPEQFVFDILANETFLSGEAQVKSCINEPFLIACQAKQQEFKPKPKPVVINPAIKTDQAVAVAKYLHDNIDVERLPHKTDAFVTVAWRSRSKNCYKDLFYSCCGANKDNCAVAYREYCIRNSWVNKHSIHTGTLQSTATGRYGGGGGGKQGCQHVPVCGRAIWTCCRRNNLEEGCTTLYVDTA